MIAMETIYTPAEETTFGIVDYLNAVGGSELLINFGNHCATPGEAFDAARALGSKLTKNLQFDPVVVMVKGARVYLSLVGKEATE